MFGPLFSGDEIVTRLRLVTVFGFSSLNHKCRNSVGRPRCPKARARTYSTDPGVSVDCDQLARGACAKHSAAGAIGFAEDSIIHVRIDVGPFRRSH